MILARVRPSIDIVCSSPFSGLSITMRGLVGPRQLTNLDSPSGLEVRIACQHRFRMFEIVRAHPQIADEVRRQWRRGAGLANACAVADRAAALEMTAFPQPSEIWRPFSSAIIRV